jgi:sugar phosphate isomerase/epimerase
VVARVLDTALELGAPHVRVWAPFGVEPGSARTAEVVDSLAVVSEAAADRELTVALEHHGGTLTATAASATALLDAVDAPNLSTYWQPPYWLAARPPADDATEVKGLGSRLSHLHVYEWASAEDRRPLAEGGARWRSVLGAAASTPGPERPSPRVAFVEFVADDDPAALLRDARTLHALLEEQP